MSLGSEYLPEMGFLQTGLPSRSLELVAGKVLLRQGYGGHHPSLRTSKRRFRAKDGGAEGSRTPDLLIANETLYQLSYDPSLAARTHIA